MIVYVLTAENYENDDIYKGAFATMLEAIAKVGKETTWHEPTSKVPHYHTYSNENEVEYKIHQVNI